MDGGGNTTHGWGDMPPPPASGTLPSYVEAAPAPPGGTLFGALAALVTVMLVAGIVGAVVVGGRSHSTPNPVALITAAPNATTGGGSAHFTSTVAISGIANIQFTLSGASDFASKSTEAQLSVGDLTESIRYVGGAEYFQSPLIRVPGGAHWIKILPQDLGVSPTSLATTDPTQGLQFLGGMVGSPRATGKQAIDGVTTTHYQVVLNLLSVFQKVGKAESTLSPNLAKGFQALAGQLDLTRVPGDVWLDSAGRVRRLRYTLDFQVAGQAINEVATSDFSDFGAAVHVSAPAAGDTVAFSAVKNQFSALLSGLG